MPATLTNEEIEAVRELLARAASGELAGADTFTPDVGQQIDQDGRVTYDFDATLHARGIDFDQVASAVFDPQPVASVRWLRQPDGARCAYLTSYEDSNAPPNLRRNITRLAAQRDQGNGVGSAELQLTNDIAIGGDRASVTASAQAATGSGRTATVIDSAGESSFLQLATAENVKASLVIANATWPGGVQIFTGPTLTFLPGAIGAYYVHQLITNGGANDGAFITSLNPTATQCTLRFCNPFGVPAAGTVVQAYILAIQAF